MKNLITYIQESFRVNKDNKPEQIEYKYFPKNKMGLKAILRKRLKEDPDADLNDIDTSNITDMSLLFYDVDPHDIDISEWDVSNVKDMQCMFRYCENFNCDLSQWDVSNVINMQNMFYDCKKFKGEGLDNWNISDSVNTDWMFGECNSMKNKPSWYREK